MSELLVELLSEELPANVQAAAEEQFASILCKELSDAGVPMGELHRGSTPRRLVVAIEGIPTVLPARNIERLGPKTNSNEKIISAFLKATGSQKTNLSTKNTSKGECYVLNKVVQERETKQVLAVVIDKSIREMSWKKSMRWGSTTFRWARPLKSISVVFDGKAVEGAFDLGNGTNLEYTNQSVGHRFLNPESFCITDFAQYKNELALRHVVIDRNERKSIIYNDAQRIAEAQGLHLNEDNDLLEEVAGLTEWPIVLLGQFEERFLNVPPEVITTSMKANQKYFSLKKENGGLSSNFIFAAGTVTEDGGKTVVVGNEKVISARLSDALFFWSKDVSVPLIDRVQNLQTLKFHNKLGSMYDKTQRVAALSKAIARKLGADVSLVQHAANLSKADLTTSLVYEFPELQGIVGYRCALQQGETPIVAEAIRSHYAPLGPSDACPKEKTAATIALADKIDTLTGFFSIGEIPSSSRDPFSLRRTALGMVRILLENNIDYDLSEGIALSSELYSAKFPEGIDDFMRDRIRSTFLERGLPEDVISSVLNNDKTNNVSRLFERGTAIREFMKTPEGAKLLAVATRVRKILPKDWATKEYATSSKLLASDYDVRMCGMLAKMTLQFPVLDYGAKLQRLSETETTVTEFFENVRINDDNVSIRENRIGMLIWLQRFFDDVGDLKAIKARAPSCDPTRPASHSSSNTSSLDKN
ncbi:MAG: glycine--tRNA ligase subunit beta [Bdellovibrionales bacterium]